MFSIHKGRGSQIQPSEETMKRIIPQDRQKQLTTLTAEELACYSNEFEHYLRNVRNNSRRADAYAWLRCVAAFPRLAKYEGAKP